MATIISKRHPSAQPPAPEKDLDGKIDELLEEILDEQGAYLSIRVNCVSCDRRFTFEGGFEDLKNADPSMHYCGGSDRCIP